MATASAVDFIQRLNQAGLLEAGQEQELPRLRAAFPEPRALAGELVKRGWLTPYQVNQLFKPANPRLRVGAFVLLDRLGAGGMGEVFRACNRLTGQMVALKVIREGNAADSESGTRFLREIRAAAALAHPNIVRAHHADQDGSTLYLVMEYVDGQDLQKLVKQRGPLSVGEACAYIRQAALGLQHAHDRGLVHRDIKPSNLLRAVNGEVKVLDLGLARAVTAAPGAQGLTQTGTVLGTPDYLAPEQALDASAADARADIYSLGCTLYFLLTGRPPFVEGTLAQKLLAHQQVEPPAVETLRPDVPPEVAAALRRMMAKRPADRYQTAAEVATVLALFCQVGVAAAPAMQRSGSRSGESSWSLPMDSAATSPSKAPISLSDGPAQVPESGWTLSVESTVVPPKTSGPLRASKKRLWIGLTGAGALALVIMLVLWLDRSAGPDGGSATADRAIGGKQLENPPPVTKGSVPLENVDKSSIKKDVSVENKTEEPPVQEKKVELPKGPYAELFSFAPKITLDQKQKEKLAELRGNYEKSIVALDDSIRRATNSRSRDSGIWQMDLTQSRAKLVREVTRKRNAILTDAQKQALGIETFIPVYAQEKALGDKKFWDVEQLERAFVVQSRAYDPDEQVISFMVLTRKKWSNQERQRDALRWQSGAVKAVFYNKQEETLMTLDSSKWYRGITRSETKLTEQQAAEGLLRSRIRIDLAPHWGTLKNAGSVKLIYPDPQ
jgi:serine/threonine protein kinase